MGKVLYFIESGRRRKGEYYECEQCGKEFIRRIGNKRHKRQKRFCSIGCSDYSRRNRVVVNCYACKKTIDKQKSKLKQSKHGIYFCSRKCKDFSQSLRGDCVEIRPPHYGTGYHAYANPIGISIPCECIACKETRRYLLIVHHKDSNRKNNLNDNLEVLCWNCHALRHLKLEKDQWKFDPNVLTPRDKLNKV